MSNASRYRNVTPGAQRGGGERRPGGFMGGPGMHGRGMGEKARDFKGTFRKLTVYLKPHRVKFFIVMFFALAGTVFSIFGPKLTGQVTNILVQGLIPAGGAEGGATTLSAPHIDFTAIADIVILLICLYFVSNAFSFIQQYLMAGVSQKIVFDMRQQVNQKLARLPLKFFDSRTHGEIMSRVTNDLDTVATSLQQSMTQLITAVFMIVGFLVMMIITSPVLTLITLVTLPLSIIVTARITKISHRNFAAQQKELGQLNGHVEEMFTGHQIVKAFGHEKKSIARFDEVNGRLGKAAWKAQFVSGIIMPLMMFVNNIGYVAICVAGGVMAAARMILVGDIQAFIAYMRQFNWPIAQTANIANVLQAMVAAAERVFELLAEPEEIADPADSVALPRPRGDIRVQNIRFGYQDDALLMKDLSIDVRQGQTIAIVGPTGAGKTTLVNLLMRFYEIGDGKITLDGVDIRTLRRGDLRRVFGMVLQDTWLFHGTIRENIAYGKDDATEEQIVAAARTAHADHFIRALPDGYDTILSEEASNISQGEKQLLTIARAVLADPSILILDEATSNVDTRTEVAIQKAMKELMRGRTSFVIAHRLSTIRDAEIILVMNNGSIIETGTHKDLLARGGFYAELYNSQFSGAFLEEAAGSMTATGPP